MRKLAVLIVLAIGVSALFLAQARAVTKINLLGVSGDLIDLGKIKEGQIKKGSFLIENFADKPLVIRSVQPGCSCVKVISPQKEITIRPNEKAAITFSFNSTGYNGKTTEYLYLETNDLSQKFIRIKIESFVERSALSLQQRFMSFSPLFIISAGLVDGINPCAFTVIVFFMSFLFFVGYSRREMFIVGASFISAVFLTYLSVGLGIFTSLRHLSGFLAFSRLIYYLTAIIALVLGVLSLIDFWQYKKTRSADKMILKLPQFLKTRITKVINESLDKRRKGLKGILSLILAAFSCGVVVSFLESACTGQMYLPTIVFMLKESSLKARALFYLLIYNIMFIFPLILIYLLAGFGVTSATFSRLANKNIGAIKLVTALLFFALAALLLIVV